MTECQKFPHVAQPDSFISYFIIWTPSFSKILKSCLKVALIYVRWAHAGWLQKRFISLSQISLKNAICLLILDFFLLRLTPPFTLCSWEMYQICESAGTSWPFLSWHSWNCSDIHSSVVLMVFHRIAWVGLYQSFDIWAYLHTTWWAKCV